MKKKVLYIALFIVIILTITGCRGKISSKESVKEYLKEHYPNEKFKIEFYDSVELKSSTGGCKEVKGNTWEVTSKKTGISFYVQDEYSFEAFFCEYKLTDDYFDVYISKVIEELNDSRIIINEVHKSIVDENGYGYLSSINGIKLDINDFSTQEELANFIISLKKELLENSIIKEKLPSYFYFDIYNGDNIICSISLNSANTEEYIIEKLNE